MSSNKPAVLRLANSLVALFLKGRDVDDMDSGALLLSERRQSMGPRARA
jgi:hypothetical protein